MALKDRRPDEPHPKTVHFGKAQLLSLTPSDIQRHLCLKAHNHLWPQESNCPSWSGSGSLAEAEQGISHFMPNKHEPWIEGRGGNPTRHSSVTAIMCKAEEMGCNAPESVPCNLNATQSRARLECHPRTDCDGIVE